MPLECPYLEESARYERTMNGWVDVLERGRLGITVRIMDPWVGVELSAVATPTPEYGLEDVRGRVLVGSPDRIDEALAEAIPALSGLTMSAGFTRRVSEITGHRTGAQYFIDAAIEMARLDRPIGQLPPDLVARSFDGSAVGPWRLDMANWSDIPSSCYTYRPESERLFAERPVTTTMRPAFYMAPAGSERVFNRTRVARVERVGDGLRLAHAMFDEAHSMQVWYVVDAESRLVVDAGSFAPRLPYLGICTEPQARVRELVGQSVDAALRKRLGSLVGGTMGCAQLYDLTADLLKLLTLS